MENSVQLFPSFLYIPHLITQQHDLPVSYWTIKKPSYNYSLINSLQQAGFHASHYWEMKRNTHDIRSDGNACHVGLQSANDLY